eukprot:3444380-Pleurochrysis_carterae.AAC.1
MGCHPCWSWQLEYLNIQTDVGVEIERWKGADSLEGCWWVKGEERGESQVGREREGQWGSGWLWGSRVRARARSEAHRQCPIQTQQQRQPQWQRHGSEIGGQGGGVEREGVEREEGAILRGRAGEGGRASKRGTREIGGTVGGRKGAAAAGAK